MNQLHRIGGHHMSSNQPSPLQQRNQAGLFAVGSMKTSVLPLGCRTNIVSTSNCQPTGRSAKMNREPVTNTDLTANHQQINAFRTTDHLIAASSRSILNYSANSVTNRNQLNPSQTNHTSPTFLNPQLLKPNYDPANYHMRVPVNPENRLMLDSIIRQPTQHMTSPRPNYHHRNLPALPGLPVIGTCCPAVRMQMSTNRPVQLQNDDFPNAAQSRQATQQNGLQNNPANNLDNNHQRKLSPNFSDELPNSTLAATNSWSHGNRSEDGAELMNGISPSLNRYTVAINVDNIKQSVKSGDQSKDKFVDGQVKNDRLPANLAVQSGLPSLVECGCCLSGRMMLKINGLPNDLSANGLRWAEISMEEQEEERKLKKREKNRIAAERCRVKKQKHVKELEQKKEALAIEKKKLRVRIDEIVGHLKSLKADFDRHLVCGCPVEFPADLISRCERFLAEYTTPRAGHESFAIGLSGELDEPLVDPAIDYSIGQPECKQTQQTQQNAGQSPAPMCVN